MDISLDKMKLKIDTFYDVRGYRTIDYTPRYGGKDGGEHLTVTAAQNNAIPVPYTGFVALKSQ